MNRKLQSLALGSGLLISGVVLGARAENWIRPDVTGLDRVSIRAEMQHSARLARESHWSIGWAYALRHEALSGHERP